MTTTAWTNQAEPAEGGVTCRPSLSSLWPADAAERIAAARQRGESFEAIARDLGVSAASVRNRAMALGVHQAISRRRFTAGEDRIIRADYLAHVDVVVTAARLGRSPGAIRQRIFHTMKDLLKQGRTPRSWRALRRYGPSMLVHGLTPDEAATRIQAMVNVATNRARAAAVEARAKRRRERIDLMLEQIAAGRERDAAIFEARSLGAALDEIGRAIGLTRERVRQICNQYAYRIAADRMASAPSGH